MDWIQTVGRIAARATWVDWVILVVGACVLLYWLSTRTFGHFRSRGFPFARPLPFLGNMAGLAFGRSSLFSFIEDLYNQFEGYQAVGFFQSLRPTVLIRDPELIKMVTVKDFDNFVDHPDFASEKIDPIIARNLGSLKGQEWHDMRATLSPVFTSSKMRNIFKLIEYCGDQMTTFLKKKVGESRSGIFEAEMKDFFTRFANDVIATSAFGIECDSLLQPDNEFYRMGRDLTNTKGVKGLILIGLVIFPKIMELLRIPFNSPKVRNFFHSVVHNTMNQRQKNGIYRPDMLQLLMQVRQGELKVEVGDDQENIKGAKLKKLTDIDVTAQAVTFFFAGFDTVSTAMSFCAYALAKHNDVQERVQREIDEVFERHGGKLTYEAAQELKYMDMFISEVLRLHTSVPFMNRMCTKDFTIPAQGNVPAYTVRKGEIIWIPVHALHRDPKYWDDPEKFDPERFNEETKHKIIPYTYMPFGIGPRICIGNRFALLEMKVALTHILRHFSFQATTKTPRKAECAKNDLSGCIEGGFWVGIASRSSRRQRNV